MQKFWLVLAIMTSSACIFSSGQEPVPDIGSASDSGDVPDVADEPDMGSDAGEGEDVGDPPDMPGDSGDCPPQPSDALVVNADDDAVSDGVCDCECTLRDAVEATADGATISFAVEEITLADTVEVTTSGVSIDGGSTTTITGNVDTALVRLGAEASGASIQGVRFSGNGAGGVGLTFEGDNQNGSLLAADGLAVGFIVLGSGVTLSQSSTTQSSYGVLVTPQASDVILEGVSLFDGNFHGLFVMAGTGVVSLLNSEIRNFGGHGVHLRRTDARIVDNAIAGNSLHGILVDSEFSPPQARTLIAANEIGQNGLSGVEVARGGTVEIGGPRPGEACDEGCNVIGPNHIGINAQAVDQLIVNGNFIGVAANGDPRPNNAGIVAGLQNADYADTRDAIAAGGFVRRGIGGACVHSGDCLSQVDVDGDGNPEDYTCVGEQFDLNAGRVDYPGGMCTATCNDNSDCNGGVCVGVSCFAACSGPTDCRRGYACDDGACRWMPGQVPPPPVPAVTEPLANVRIGRPVLEPVFPTTCEGPCNLIAGNLGDAVNVVPGGPSVVNGNYVGLMPDPSVARPNGTTPNNHQGIVVHGQAAVASIGQNIVGSNTGAALLLRGNAEVTDNRIGIGPDGRRAYPNRQGIVVGAGGDGSSVRDNVIGGFSLVGVTVAQGAVGAEILRNTVGLDAAGTPLNIPYEAGIRVHDINTEADVTDNQIFGATNHGISVGLGAMRTTVDNVNLTNNTIEGGADVAGIEIYACTNCEVVGNTIIDTIGPGMVVGDTTPVDLSGLDVRNNTLEELGLTSGFPSAIVFLGGTGATFEGNLIDDPTDAAFVLGVRNVDVDMSRTRFVGNQILCPLANGGCQGPPFRILSGHGATIEQSIIDDTRGTAFDFVDAPNSFASVGLWGNVVLSPFSPPIRFDGAPFDDDGELDADHGANTLLNAPNLNSAVGDSPTQLTVTGDAHFAEARIDIYESDGSIDRPLLEHLSVCESTAATVGREPFSCIAPRNNLNGDPIEWIQATATGRHFVIEIGVGSTQAGTVIGVNSGRWGAQAYTVPAPSSPAAFATFIESSIVAGYPEVLAAASTSYCPNGATACVHVVSSSNETAFTVTGGTINQTSDRGWVTSRTVDYVTEVQ